MHFFPSLLMQIAIVTTLFYTRESSCGYYSLDRTVSRNCHNHNYHLYIITNGRKLILFCLTKLLFFDRTNFKAMAACHKTFLKNKHQSDVLNQCVIWPLKKICKLSFLTEPQHCKQCRYMGTKQKTHFF